MQQFARHSAGVCDLGIANATSYIALAGPKQLVTYMG